MEELSAGELAVGFDTRPFPVLDQGTLMFQVSEAAQGGLDRNGDGDAIDLVLHLVDLDPD